MGQGCLLIFNLTLHFKMTKCISMGCAVTLASDRVEDIERRQKTAAMLLLGLLTLLLSSGPVPKPEAR